ncbi:hypothetical protein MSAN_00454100 [Mycena sanguinolenta]|uniref:Uncharacterized protein n=1 Tax=Mycena sanguinolenta TaxID=230812 RepID=A0A8H6ZHG8_9AGAR|nr:hypothetical protein MSAN_00454100 [Mycena sanguinolenta]
MPKSRRKLSRPCGKNIARISELSFGRIGRAIRSASRWAWMTWGKDLENKIRHQGDHVIEYLGGDPHKDKIIYQVSSAQTDAMDSMGDIWRGINDRSGNTSETEKIINKISDTTSAVVNAASSTDGVVGFAKDVIANDTIKAVGNTFLEGIPTLMSALETLSEIHPFLKVAYLPFKLIYYQYAIRMPFAQFPNLFRETQRRDNDQRRTTLFGKIKDVMDVLLELKDFKKDDTRQTPDKKPVLGRLASLCKDMKKDIEECYNVLNAQEKRSLAIKFLKAASWNKELGVYASRFTNRRDELTFALSLRTAITIEEMNSNMRIMMKMFATMLTPQERDMELWISRNGGEKGVLGDDKKCAAMIKYEASLAASSSVSHVDKGRPGADEDARKEEKAIAALRKEYREDIGSIIQENLESYSKRFEMGLDELGKDLGNKIEHEADRLARIFRGGPHQRIEDKMIYHVWKDQGWKGSAKTWPLILALRDYFVERIKHGQLLQTSTDVGQNRHPVSTFPQKDDDDNDDPEIDISVALPDIWMVSYLQVKHLRYLEQAIDPDASGFTTISEINAFTRARPEDWSLPRWISYWAIGWQIYATKYCVEIEELFNQMHLLKLEMAVKTPGNTRYVNDYIEGCWQHVTALTSSIERYSGGELRFEEKFSPYIESQEAILKERLGKIQYDIDAIETVSLVLRGDRVEGSIFILLALLMRRHLAKMHLGLTQELDSRELWDDVDTITEVADAVWIRFVDLKEQFQLREAADLKPVFEWFSCGLFKNYWQWDNWLQTKHFMENDMKAWTGDTIRELDPSELVGILAYTDTPGPKTNEPSDTTTSDSVAIESATGEGTPITDPESAVRTVEALSADQVTPAELNPSSSKPSEVEMSIPGTWYGFHWTETQQPFLAMVAFNVKCSERDPEFETETKISGDGFSANGNSFTLSGYMSSTGDQPAGSFSLNFQRIYEDGTWIQYNGTFNPDREIMTGTFEHAIASGSCLFKKVPTSAIMCARPLVAEPNAKELWSFALNAVVNDLRQKKLSLSYIRERMIDIWHTLAFMHRDNVDLLTDPEEKAQYSKLLMKFSLEESAELNKLYQWYARSGDLQPAGYSCDGCGDSLVRSRVVCLECVSTDYPERTVDFCSKPECVATESIPQRTDVEHHPDHMMVRFRDLLLLKDYFGIKQRAGYTLDWARSIYKDPTEDTSLTMPLPESPVAAVDLTEMVKDNSNGETNPTIVEDAPTPTPIPISPQTKSAPQLGLPALDTTVSDSQPLASDPGTPSSDGLLSAAVTPVETQVEEDQTLNCGICHERIVAPCWSCVTCYESTWVCDACDKATNELSPWDYQKRYRAEVEAMGGRDDGSSHTVFHALVRFVCPKSDSTSSETNSKITHTAADAATPAQPSSNSSWDQIEKRIEELVTAGFEAVNTRFEAVNSHVDKRLDEVEAKLESRLVNIERLLNLLVAAGQPKSQS